ncbi:MAG: ATP-dependent DNA helicase [Patescibacteria group bacterium]
MAKQTILDKVFEEKYKNLNKGQKEAVDTVEGPVMVIAGPGTGKTSILTLRIANILKTTDTPPSGILALTFTDAGVKAMKVKLRDIIGTRADEVRIHTFHSFSASIIAEFPEHFIHIHRAKQLTDVEVESIMREILNKKKYASLRPIGDADYYLGKIISTIHDAKKENETPETLRDFIAKETKRINTDESFRSSRGPTKGELKADSKKRLEKCEKTLLFTDVWDEYEAIKKEKRKIDFDDLLFELSRAIKEDELLLQLIQEKFLYVLLDEHQDTNDLQNHIVGVIMSFFDTPNLFVVGDEKQAIYRFQGASVENFLKFQKLWRDMKVITLTENYRSHQTILDAVFSMIENNYEDDEHKTLRVELSSKSGEKEKPIDIVETPDVESQDAFLVSEIKNILSESPNKTIAIINRKNREVDHMLSLCEVNGIEAKAERGGDLFSHPVGVATFAMLDYINDPSKVESLLQSIGMGLWRLELDERIKITKQVKGGDNSGLTVVIPALDELRSRILSLGAIEFLVYLGEVSGLTELISKRPLSVEVWRSVIALATDIANSRDIGDAKTLAQVLLDYRLSAEKKIVKIPSGIADSRVVITTAHGSKGLEYDYVFVPYATDESWVGRSHGRSFVLPQEKGEGDEIKDARRLFYVAITRAKSHVSILTPKMDMDGKTLTPVRFLEEIDSRFVSSKNFVGKLPITTSVYGDIKKKEKKELVEYAKNILQEKGLSVTAVNHYFTCTRQFLYKSILKIPEPPTPSSEKGIAMHKAFAEVWSLDKKDVKSIEKTINYVVAKHIKESLLTPTDKENVLEELLKDSSAVSSSMVEHFNLEGRVLTENWNEKSFVTNFEDKQLVINLHGQLDAIVDTEKKVFVFDYKTKKPMSEKAIKGETQSDDGNYWRQLVFYRMLLDGNHNYKNKAIQPSLWFVKPDNGVCKEAVLPIEESDIETLQKELTVLVEDVWSGKFIDKKCSDPKCKWCAMIEL